MVGGQHGENGVSVPELVEVDGVKERETLPTLNLITSVRGKSTRIIFIMTWNVAKHKTVHVGIPVIFLNGSHQVMVMVNATVNNILLISNG